MLRRSIFAAPEGEAATGTGTGTTATGTGTQQEGAGQGTGTGQQSGQQGTGTTQTGTAAPPPKAEEISVKWPDGFAADEGMSTKFVSIMKDGKLTGQERTQALANLYVEGVKGIETKHAEQVVQWATEAKEKLGDKFDATLTKAKSIIERVAPPGFREMLTKTGLGNHVDTITMFAKLGELIAEDRLGGKEGGGLVTEKSRDQLLREAFPNSPDMFPAKQ